MISFLILSSQQQETLLRPTLYGSKHAISAGHYLAAAAGFSILEAGGNAIDAGVCAGIALAVLHPDEVNFGGVAPIMIRTGAGRIVTIAGLGHWPKAFPADLFMRKFNGEMPAGILRTLVPAAPDAWLTALKDFGTMNFADVAKASISFARDGFAVFDYLAHEIELHQEEYRQWPGNTAIFLPGGRPPKVGDRFVQSDLAGVLDYMAAEESAHARHGREAGLNAARAAFYNGDIARRIVEHQKENGGYLREDDLADFHCRYEPAVITRWRDFQVATCGPWCQGPVLAQTLLMLEKAGLSGLKHNEPAYIHLVVEVIKAAMADREYHYGDPRFVDVGLERLLSAEHVARRVAAIDPNQAMPDMPAPLYGQAKKSGILASGEPERHGDTSYLCVVDRWGNAFSGTPSDATWRGPIIPGLGFVASIRGSQSRPDPLHPSGVAPGKRPRLTPNPAIAIRADGAIMPFGAPEGDSQVQGMLQVFLNAFHFGMDIQEAIDQPRFISHSFPSSFAPYKHYPGLVTIEDRFPDETLTTLEKLGHKLQKLPPYSRKMASVEAVLYEPHRQFLRTGADPRQPAYAIAI
jgi:gamma-glutamyltranspeptidase/glutathione hydrolase